MSDRVTWNGEKATRMLMRVLETRLDVAATFIVNGIKMSLNTGGGTVGTRSGGGRRNHVPSAPWNPPHKVTGHLQRNVTWDRFGPLKRRIGTGIGKRESVGYAMWLEFGTGPHVVTLTHVFGRELPHPITYTHPGMLPRPWLRPGMYYAAPYVRKILSGRK